MPSPIWARTLADQVMADHHQEPVAITWRRSASHADSSGRAQGPSERWPDAERRVIVTAGKSRIDQRLVLLHECAHILTQGHHHDATFWDAAWALYRRYGVPIRFAQKREYGYRKEARAAYARSIRRGTDA